MENRDLTWVRLDLLLPEEGARAEGPFPRREAGDITGLMSSVLIHGVLAPVLVRRRPQGFQIVCGYRRCLAARAAGLEQVPALVADIQDAEAIRCYLAENIARRPMDARSEDSALETLKALRWRTETLTGDMGVAGVIPQVEDEEESTAGDVIDDGGEETGPARLIEIDVPAETSFDAEAASLVAAGSAALGETIIAEMETFLDEMASARKLSPAATERLVEQILILAAQPASPIDWPGLAAHGGVLACHSVLAAALAAHVCSRLGWGPVEVRNFATGALLHDVGMAFIKNPDIRAPRALDPEERLPLASHTRIGYALIAGARAWPSEVALCARDHHERWNGTGYPSGRRGGEVAFFPRLLAPIDTFAALIMPRPHRNALLPPFALERLATAFELGHFDPQVLLPLSRNLGPGAVPFIRVTGEALHEATTGNSVEMGPDLVTMLAK